MNVGAHLLVLHLGDPLLEELQLLSANLSERLFHLVRLQLSLVWRLVCDSLAGRRRLNRLVIARGDRLVLPCASYAPELAGLVRIDRLGLLLGGQRVLGLLHLLRSVGVDIFGCPDR